MVPHKKNVLSINLHLLQNYNYIRLYKEYPIELQLAGVFTKMMCLHADLEMVSLRFLI